MTWVDVMMVAIIALLTYGGVKRGLIGEAFDLLILFVGTTIAFNLTPYLSRLFRSLLHWPGNMADFTAFFLLFLPIGALIFTLGCVLDKAAKLNVVLKDLNSAGGGFLAFLKSWVTCWILLMVMSLFPFGNDYHQALYRAPVAGIVRGLNSTFGSIIEGTTPKGFSKKIVAVIRKTEEKPGKGDSK